MLQQIKFGTFLLIVCLIVGCSGAPKLTVISPAGEKIPEPFYTAGTTNGSHMRFTWFYVKYEGIEDADKTIQPIPIHLDRNENYSIDRENTHGLQMNLRVFNPGVEEYTVYVTNKIVYSDSKEVRNHYVAGKSFLEFRQWNFTFPYNDRIKKYESFIEIRRDDNVILRTKKFSYSVY